MAGVIGICKCADSEINPNQKETPMPMRRRLLERGVISPSFGFEPKVPVEGSSCAQYVLTKSMEGPKMVDIVFKELFVSMCNEEGGIYLFHLKNNIKGRFCALIR